MSNIKIRILQLLNKLNFKLEHRNSWYKKNENYLAEIEDDDLNFIKEIDRFSMCKPPEHWAIIQSINHIKNNNIDGDLVECGVWEGGNIILFGYLLRKFNLDKKIYAYDTYSGMVEPSIHDATFKDSNLKNSKNIYKNKDGWVKCDLKKVKMNISKFIDNHEEDYIFIEGDVRETLNNQNNLPDKISLLRLDTDCYESTSKELEVLFPRLQKNGVLIIDDYGHWKGQKKAVDEYFNLKEDFHWLHRIDYKSRLLIKK